MSKESEKEELLEEYDSYVQRRSKLDGFYFLYMFLTLTFIAMFAFPKIYITQQIYYKSRDIAKLKHEYETLKEENKIISASVESIKFKNQILDTLF
jgi:cell division protein FtsL